MTLTAEPDKISFKRAIKKAPTSGTHFNQLIIYSILQSLFLYGLQTSL